MNDEEEPAQTYPQVVGPIVGGVTSPAPSPFPGFQLPLPGMLPVAHLQQVQQLQVWQSQFPSPEAIERYALVEPKSFDRIITMAEKGQDATIRANERAINLQASDVKRGQSLGFVVTAGAMFGALWSGTHGQTLLAIAFLSVPVMTVAKSFVESAAQSWQAKAQAKAAEAQSQDEAGET